jgi:uncharacterized membrane protein YcaP (DUF421 family)
MEIVARTAIMFFFLFGVTRAIGKKELAEISTFELILLITMGDIVQQGVTQNDFSITGAFIAVSTMAVLVVAMSYITYRWPRAERIVGGVPVVLVRHGKVVERALEYERLTEGELRDAAREQGIDDLRTVEYAILEPDGKFSFLSGATSRQQHSSGNERED